MPNTATASVLILISLSLGSPAFAFESDYFSVRAEGNGRDVILIHGFACSPEVWTGLSKEIGSAYRLHVVSVAGFAGTRAPSEQPESYLTTLRDEIARYIDEQQLKKPVFIGHSMGGLTSVLVASEYPEQVGAIVVVDSLPFFSLIFNPNATTELVSEGALALENQTLSVNDAQFELQAKGSAAILTKTGDKQPLLVKWSKESDRKIYARYFREIMTYDARPKLAGVTCPVTVLYAYDEAMGRPAGQVSKLYTDAYSSLKTARLQSIRGSFHFIMWDQPDAFHAAVKEALVRQP